ncbi:hypothetical protein RF11_04938 [Thelohanellus kitauei]|uniref:Uncharacterized protein n=1 Tax=Thelohanellus kitauei TaxID=669202 RepID=A0A0C2JGY1_THEKT|nr:hypothetical protein RF11_04938 [Thelohanellus kitauei]
MSSIINLNGKDFILTGYKFIFSWFLIENSITHHLRWYGAEKEEENFCIYDISLSDQGAIRVETARSGILYFDKDLPGLFIIKEVLIETLIHFGAKDDICAYLVSKGVGMFAWCGELDEDYWWCIDECINSSNNKANEGGDLSNTMLTKCPKLFHNLKGIVELSPYGQLLVPAMNITNSTTYVSANSNERNISLGCIIFESA